MLLLAEKATRPLLRRVKLKVGRAAVLRAMADLREAGAAGLGPLVLVRVILAVLARIHEAGLPLITTVGGVLVLAAPGLHV